jgi:hypothetical protein
VTGPSIQTSPTLCVIDHPQVRCSICKSAHAAELSDLCAMRVRKQPLNGKRVTVELIIHYARDECALELSGKSIDRHTSRHITVPKLTDALGVRRSEAADVEVAELFQKLDPATATDRDYLDALRTAAILKLRADPGQVTLAMGLQAVQTGMRMRQEANEGELMALLAGSVAAAERDRRARMTTAEVEATATEVVDVVDAEIVEGEE